MSSDKKSNFKSWNDQEANLLCSSGIAVQGHLLGELINMHIHPHMLVCVLKSHNSPKPVITSSDILFCHPNGPKDISLT